MNKDKINNYAVQRKAKLLLEAELSEYADHSGEKGRANEKYLLRCIREFLPKRFGIGTGFVENYKRHQSKQLDIIIFDDINNAPLFVCDAWSIYPIEMVHAVIEVKTTLTINELKKAFKSEGTDDGSGGKNTNKKSLRRMAEVDKKHYVQQKENSLSPRFYIFAYKLGKVTEKTLLKNLKELSLKYNVHCHGLYVLDKDILVVRQPLYSREKYDHWIFRNKGLEFYLNSLLKSCLTMGIGITDRNKYIEDLDKIESTSSEVR